MDDTLARIWEHLVGRLSGPLTFRLLLQPTMCSLFAVRDGLRDIGAGLPFTLAVAQLAYEGDEGPELAYRIERFGT